MTDHRDPKIDRSGIHIERDLAESVAIEDELDSNIARPFYFPSPERRKTAGWIFVAGAFIVALTVDGGWAPAIGFLALAGWQFGSAWPLNIDENVALRTAGKAVDFAVGHASAAVTFKGWRSRPRWAVILYSATEPPDQRGLVVIDAVEGDVVEDVYVEEIPAV